MNIEGFATAPGKPVPNDDLDLQLVWLHAVESRGILAVSASMLGDDIVNLSIRWWLPEGFAVTEGRKTAIITNKNPHDSGTAALKFRLKAGDRVDAVNRCVLEIVPESRFSALYVPVVLLG